MDEKEAKKYFFAGALDPVGLLDDSKEERKDPNWKWKVAGGLLSPLLIGLGVSKEVATHNAWNALTKDMAAKPGFWKRIKFEFTGKL